MSFMNPYSSTDPLQLSVSPEAFAFGTTISASSPSPSLVALGDFVLVTYLGTSGLSDFRLDLASDLTSAFRCYFDRFASRKVNLGRRSHAYSVF